MGCIDLYGGVHTAQRQTTAQIPIAYLCLSYDVFTLTVTYTETETKTDKMGIDSLCSVNTSTQPMCG